MVFREGFPYLLESSDILLAKAEKVDDVFVMHGKTIVEELRCDRV